MKIISCEKIIHVLDFVLLGCTYTVITPADNNLKIYNNVLEIILCLFSTIYPSLPFFFMSALQCQYTSEGRSELCRKENHSIRRYKATKRCFECRDCHQRCFTYNAPFPVEACAKCGGRSHEATSFYRERKGPKLPTEGLLLRGEEEKFLNSLK